MQHLYGRLAAYLKPGSNDGNLLQALHPTPAVCGRPREEAMRWGAGGEGGRPREEAMRWGAGGGRPREEAVRWGTGEGRAGQEL